MLLQDIRIAKCTQAVDSGDEPVTPPRKDSCLSPEIDVKPSPQPSSNILRETDGLHKAALQNGCCYVARITFNEGYIAHDTLSSLVGDSDLVVTGKVGTLATKLFARGTRLRTDAEFTIDRVLAGTMSQPAYRTITVSIPGGTFEYPDGSSASIEVVDYPRLQTDQNYILFLHSSDDGTYSVVGGPKGTFKVGSDELIPEARQGSPIASRFSHFSPKAFERELANAVGSKEIR